MPQVYKELFDVKKGKPSIVIKVKNWNDGVGDFELFRKMAEKIQYLNKSKGYELIGILEIMSGGSNQNSIREFISSELNDNNPFDRLYIFDEITDDKKIKLKRNDKKIKINWSENNIENNESNTYLSQLEETASNDIHNTSKILEVTH